MLAETNRKLGGCTSPYTFSQLNDICATINQNVTDGTLYAGGLICSPEVSSIKNIADAQPSSFIVHPNPSSGWLTVDLPYSEESFLEILDMTGKIQLRKVVPAVTRSTRVPIHGLTPGMYLMHREDGSGSTMTKFIVSD